MEAVLPCFKAAVERAEECILRLHACNFAPASSAPVAQPSGPVSELTRHLSHCRHVPGCWDVLALVWALTNSWELGLGCRFHSVSHMWRLLGLASLCLSLPAWRWGAMRRCASSAVGRLM